MTAHAMHPPPPEPWTWPEAEWRRREFDRAHAEGGLFLLTLHPHVIGYRSRLFILEELIEHMQAQSGVWFATHEQVARYVAGGVQGPR